MFLTMKLALEKWFSNLAVISHPEGLLKQILRPAFSFCFPGLRRGSRICISDEEPLFQRNAFRMKSQAILKIRWELF